MFVRAGHGTRQEAAAGERHLLKSVPQGRSDGGHVVGVEGHAGAAHLLGKNALALQLRHKGADSFLKKDAGKGDDGSEQDCTGQSRSRPL